ncbi:MAG: TerB family tellurite resistance protein [Bacteroidetes bacterium]|nr:TerB family tellurite resistance protein [Bacteroidota bacterium]
MKRILISITICLSLSGLNRLFGQSDEAQQLLLNWEKLQELEKILDNMYVGYKILDKGYTTIKNISEGNYTLHQLFLDGLMAVSPAVRNYKRIPFIIDYQKLLVKEYKNAYTRFRSDPHFTPQEIEYVANVYNYLFTASLRNIDDLVMITTATKLRMSDDERMRAIDRIFYDMESKVGFLRSFNSSTQLLAIQRARAANDVRTLNHLYGIN